MDMDIDMDTVTTTTTEQAMSVLDLETETVPETVAASEDHNSKGMQAVESSKEDNKVEEAVTIEDEPSTNAIASSGSPKASSKQLQEAHDQPPALQAPAAIEQSSNNSESSSSKADEAAVESKEETTTTDASATKPVSSATNFLDSGYVFVAHPDSPAAVVVASTSAGPSVNSSGSVAEAATPAVKADSANDSKPTDSTTIPPTSNAPPSSVVSISAPGSTTLPQPEQFEHDEHGQEVEHYDPNTPPARIQAYARLEFPFFNFYIQKLSVTIGRRPPVSRGASIAPVVKTIQDEEAVAPVEQVSELLTTASVAAASASAVAPAPAPSTTTPAVDNTIDVKDDATSVPPTASAGENKETAEPIIKVKKEEEEKDVDSQPRPPPHSQPLSPAADKQDQTDIQAELQPEQTQISLPPLHLQKEESMANVDVTGNATASTSQLPIKPEDTPRKMSTWDERQPSVALAGVVPAAEGPAASTSAQPGPSIDTPGSPRKTSIPPRPSAEPGPSSMAVTTTTTTAAVDAEANETSTQNQHQPPSSQQTRDIIQRATKDDKTQVDVDLGPIKAVSRDHARLFFDNTINPRSGLTNSWSLEVKGRNGLVLDGKWRAKGEVCRLNNGSRIQIAERIFHFVLPQGVPYPHAPPSPTFDEFYNGQSFGGYPPTPDHSQSPIVYGSDSEELRSDNDDFGYGFDDDDEDDDDMGMESSAQGSAGGRPSGSGSAGGRRSNAPIQYDANGQPIKRKRGRPKKQRTAEQLAALELERQRRLDPTIPRRPRGRPPKHKKDEFDHILTEMQVQDLRTDGPDIPVPQLNPPALPPQSNAGPSGMQPHPQIPHLPPGMQLQPQPYANQSHKGPTTTQLPVIDGAAAPTLSKKQQAELKKLERQREKEERQRLKELEKEQKKQEREKAKQEAKELKAREVAEKKRKEDERKKAAQEEAKRLQEEKARIAAKEKEEKDKQKAEALAKAAEAKAKAQAEGQAKPADGKGQTGPDGSSNKSITTGNEVKIKPAVSAQSQAPGQSGSHALPVQTTSIPVIQGQQQQQQAVQPKKQSQQAKAHQPSAPQSQPQHPPSQQHQHPSSQQPPQQIQQQQQQQQSMHQSTPAPNPFIPTNQFQGKPEKPPYSYPALIAQAIYSTPQRQAPLQHIHMWIPDKYPFFRDPANAHILAQAIKQNLSVNRAFVNILLPTGVALWAIEPEQAKLFDGNTFLPPPAPQPVQYQPPPPQPQQPQYQHQQSPYPQQQPQQPQQPQPAYQPQQQPPYQLPPQQQQQHIPYQQQQPHQQQQYQQQHQQPQPSHYQQPPQPQHVPLQSQVYTVPVPSPAMSPQLQQQQQPQQQYRPPLNGMGHSASPAPMPMQVPMQVPLQQSANMRHTPQPVQQPLQQQPHQQYQQQQQPMQQPIPTYQPTPAPPLVQMPAPSVTPTPAPAHSASPAPSSGSKMPILISRPSASYSKPAPPAGGMSNDPSSMVDPEGYPPIAIHEGRMHLSPTVFASLTAQQLSNLQSIDTKQALNILQAFVVNYFKTELKRRKKAEKMAAKGIPGMGGGGGGALGMNGTSMSASPSPAPPSMKRHADDHHLGGEANKVQRVS